MSMQPSGTTIPQFTAADRFRKARELTGMDQRTFAEAIDVDKNTVSNYETGATKRPMRAVVNAWALATGVPVAWLRDGIEPDSGPDNTPDQANDQSGWIHGLPSVA